MNSAQFEKLVSEGKWQDLWNEYAGTDFDQFVTESREHIEIKILDDFRDELNESLNAFIQSRKNRKYESMTKKEPSNIRLHLSECNCCCHEGLPWEDLD